MADSKASFLWAVKQQESGGNYNARNGSSGALGAYQVMPANVPSWTKATLGRSLTPAQFLADPAAQDAVANKILGGYYDQYGARGAAAMWYSGQPDPNKTYGTPSVADYVSQVVSRMSSSSPVGSASPVGEATPAGLGDLLGDGLAQGLVTTFKSILPPIFRFGFWGFESLFGFAAVVAGIFLVAQKSDTVHMLENKGMAADKKRNAEQEKKTKQTQSAQRAADKKALTAYHRMGRQADKKRETAAKKAASKPRSPASPKSRSEDAPNE